MSSCYITCPFCDLEFEKTDININDDEVTCKHCNQDFSVEYECDITAEVTECTVGDEFDEKRKIGKSIKYEMFIIHLGLNDMDDIYYSRNWDTNEQKDYKQAKVFKTEESAKSFINSLIDKQKYPNAKLVQFKECVAKENDSKEKGTGLFN